MGEFGIAFLLVLLIVTLTQPEVTWLKSLHLSLSSLAVTMSESDCLN